MILIIVVDNCINSLIILNNKQLEFFKRCGSLVIRMWTVEDYRAVQEKGHCYTQVIPEAGAIALGGLP
jgi:hypothetical protein